MTCSQNRFVTDQKPEVTANTHILPTALLPTQLTALCPPASQPVPSGVPVDPRVWLRPSMMTHSRCVIISWQYSRDPAQPAFLPCSGTHVRHGSLVDTSGCKLNVFKGFWGRVSGTRCCLHYQRHTEEARCPAQIQPSACHRAPWGWTSVLCSLQLQRAGHSSAYGVGREEGMLSLWAPGEETRDLLLSRPTPSPQ